MLVKIIEFSIKNKLIIFLFTAFLIGFGLFSLSRLSIGAVPDITNNQVQVITTSRNLSTQDMEQFITYPVEIEMANLPGVQEIRSVSKFGLSVVTIVFDEELGTYLPRQLIAEKIKSASEQIPSNFGTPEMGPITTGLGEIYQYILDVKPGYEDVYSVTDLRTIQDWIVKRQLSGIPGVVEVNTWGGFLKQYEVAIKTEKLNAMNITTSEILTAIEKNNSVTGGGYIEKTDQAYFIRGEGLVESLLDIENIVVKKVNGIPVYIKDVAKVGFGHAVRFGAITGNGEGEKVLGQVMMLKDANSNAVIESVKERVDEIQKSLPEGVFINPFLERSLLIEKTTETIAENLILGCLIVIFVVVLLLGNIRSGLVVASVIPLSLLFALSMMYLFDIDANLMSLGAIDFGIIIDGAVIIVEFIAYRMTQDQQSLENITASQLREKKDTIAVFGASRMMNSAIFGQLIILIVFIPILSLAGVEGKMFKPMALTFSFALIGAMILCLTYVPVVSAIFIKPSKQGKRNVSRVLMSLIFKAYDPAISWALKMKKLVLAGSLLLLALAVFLFSQMGGEFVPTLDEGDFVIQPVLKTGTTLSNTVEITTRIEQILLDQFPEVDQVVSRIGAAEVPTDPMSMEESDVIITLHPKSEWPVERTKDELAAAMKDALMIIPGMEMEFTQPIEMRFNELITGVRADIAVKVFGEDLEILNAKANEIKALIQDVEGAADIIVEKTAGLPQMSVSFEREKLARYGLNVSDVNNVISMGFAGASTGVVFEGEKRFDLVVRLDESVRNDISHLANLFIDLPEGGKVPLRELATITYEKGAAKISRDDTKRRTVVGINVRNRDLESVVDDIRSILDAELTLPPGYTVTYGGQFENLQSARERLKIAVPVALLLIFLLLYFAFKSIKEALLIFSAIPLSATGGVFLLWLRDIPFSISAGVGFIALFGIAVLNGIVLIEHYKELKKEGMQDMNNLIVRGTRDRMRAVLLTASAAALGFLPMAISTGAGAEVQRPLATVVVGGLISATFLTLVVLPVLYSIFGKNETPKIPKGLALVVLLLTLISLPSTAQTPLTYEQIHTLALQNNAKLEASALQVEEAGALVGSAFTFDKTEVYYHYDEANLAYNNQPLKVFGVSQKLLFPSRYFTQKQANETLVEAQRFSYQLSLQSLEGELASAYYQLLYEQQRSDVYAFLDSLYQRFDYAADKRFELGESNYLEKITARAKQRELYTLHQQSQDNIKQAYLELQRIVQADQEFEVEPVPLLKLEPQKINLETHPGISLYEQQIEFYAFQNKLKKQELLPDFNLSYFQGSNSELQENLYGYQIGITIPLLFNSSKIRASTISEDISVKQAEEYKIQLETTYSVELSRVQQFEKALAYYEAEGISLSEEIINMASKSYQTGEIDFFQYIQSIENAMEINLSYLENLNNYNQAVIRLNYLTL
jgi:cobalt-zinc-cadmium resistance protein CzcA